MNQKIKQLAEEAGSIMYGGTVPCLFGEADIEAFAKLLVKECARIAEEQSRVYTGEHKEGAGCQAAAHSILSTFKD